MPIEIREVAQGDKKGMKDFLLVAKDIYASDPNWVRPLDMEIEERLTKLLEKYVADGRSTPGAPQQNAGPVTIRRPAPAESDGGKTSTN